MKRIHGTKAPLRDRSVQLTVRGVPASVAVTFKRKALREDKSLNGILIEALCKEAGAGAELVHDDLDFLVGTWDADPEFDAARRAQHQIDQSLWK
jgi:hypothetical protein